MRGKREEFAPILSALRKFGGYFTFEDEGDQFVVVLKKDAARLAAPPETQLTLTPKEKAGVVPDANWEEVNHDIALFQEPSSPALEEDDLNVPWAEASAPSVSAAASPAPRRIRFEPIRGDLPPELQE